MPQQKQDREGAPADPRPERGLGALLDSWEPLDEELPEIEDLAPEPEDVF